MDVFTALANPTRRNIIGMLAEQGELSATDIADKFDSSPPAISQHLKVLREAKLIQMEKRSRQRIYRLNAAGIGKIDRWVRETKELWDARLDRLDALISKSPNKK
jgi:DNA-binding transcriptional ArsR family regulator